MKSPAFACITKKQPSIDTLLINEHSLSIVINILTPYSRIPVPHSSQNFRCSAVPDPLSETCSLSAPCFILKVSFLIFVVMPNGLPVNF